MPYVPEFCLFHAPTLLISLPLHSPTLPLQPPPSLLPPQAYTLAQHVAFEETWLLYGRHLDQVLLCCLYSICKVGGWLGWLGWLCDRAGWPAGRPAG